MTFTASFHCRSRLHCVTCRSRTEAARAWRASVGAPEGDCPYGVPFGCGPPAPQIVEAAKPRPLCVHIGGIVGKAECKTCGGGKMEALHSCQIHGTCTITRPAKDGSACCAPGYCTDYEPKPIGATNGN